MSKKVTKKPLSVPKKEKNDQKKFQRSLSSVPKQKKKWPKKVSKEFVKCAQTKRSSKEVPQVCPNNEKTQKKRFKSYFTSYFSGLVTSFKISPPLLGTIFEKGDETRKRDETEYETQEDFYR